MKKTILSIGIIWLLLACNNRQETGSNLLGKWEAEYLVRSGQDTIFYREGTSSACAYIILPFDYNSGFELMEEHKGELIWCGRNKEQFFTWSYENKVMTVQFNDQTASVAIENLRDSSMEITVSSGDRYRMKKYDTQRGAKL